MRYENVDRYNSEDTEMAKPENPSTTKKTFEFQNVDQTEADENDKTPRVEGLKEQDAQTKGATNADLGVETNMIILDATQRMARQSAEVIRLGIHAVTKVQAPLIEVGENHRRRLVDRISQATDMYYDAAQETSPNVLALVESSYAFLRGMQKSQNASFVMLRSSMDGLYRKRENVSQINSPKEFAKIQSDIYLDTLNTLFKGYTTLWQNMAQLTQDTLQPLKTPPRQ
jgi:hypothetical protein